MHALPMTGEACELSLPRAQARNTVLTQSHAGPRHRRAQQRHARSFDQTSKHKLPVRHVCLANSRRGTRALERKNISCAYTCMQCLAHNIHALPATGESCELSSLKAQARQQHSYSELCHAHSMHAQPTTGGVYRLS
jgi:hypothetical protein